MACNCNTITCLLLFRPAFGRNSSDYCCWWLMLFWVGTWVFFSFLFLISWNTKLVQQFETPFFPFFNGSRWTWCLPFLLFTFSFRFPRLRWKLNKENMSCNDHYRLWRDPAVIIDLFYLSWKRQQGFDRFITRFIVTTQGLLCYTLLKCLPPSLLCELSGRRIDQNKTCDERHSNVFKVTCYRWKRFVKPSKSRWRSNNAPAHLFNYEQYTEWISFLFLTGNKNDWEMGVPYV